MKKTPKKLTTSKLKKKLDAIFSIYIRQKYADKNKKAKCYTCGAYKHYKELHCGHFISRSYLATRFEEDNCRPQCVGCNIFGGGRPVEFAQHLDKECGDGTSARLYKLAQQITKDYPYEEKINYYEQLLKSKN